MATVNYAELAKSAPAGPEALPIGEYDVEVSGAEFKVASTGSPMYMLELTVEGGPHKGRKIRTNLVLKLDNPNSVSYFFGKMRTLGIDQAFFASVNNEESAICQALIGKKAHVATKHRDFDGTTQSEVTRLSPSKLVPSTPTAPAASAPVQAAPVAAGPPDLPPGI